MIKVFKTTARFDRSVKKLAKNILTLQPLVRHKKMDSINHC